MSALPTTAAVTGPALETYDRIVVMFSGGKDSLACLLHLLDRGVDRARIELWHHDVDGREGSSLMDWPITRGYCEAVAAALGVPLFYSWRAGGFEREMNRAQAPTAPVHFQTPEGERVAGGKGPQGTRGKFPQVSADLSVRWCSSALKIDVSHIALRNQTRFNGKRTLVVTGERAEESPNRARYQVFEPHKVSAPKFGRHVDAWRPVHAWSERQVWAVIQRHGIAPHPAYQLGWGRVSCAACIFGSPDQWASLRAVNPAQFAQVVAAEQRTGLTIQRRRSVGELAAAGKAYESITAELVKLATSTTYPGPVKLAPEAWTLPAGAFGDSCGPT